MTEEEWLTCQSSEQMLSFLKNGSGRAKLRKVANRKRCERKLRLMMVSCIRRMWHLLSDQRSKDAVETAERFADGLVGMAQLKAACLAARDYHVSIRSQPNWTAFCAACAAAEIARANTKQGFSWCQYAADVATLAPTVRSEPTEDGGSVYDERLRTVERAHQAHLLRDVFGNPFRPARFAPEWRTDTARALAAQMYESRDFGAMPILADALQDAGCDNDDILNHCRGQELHVRGCFVVDLVLSRE